MNCNPCIESKPVPACGGNLIIGTVDTDQFSVFVFIQNNATGYIAIQEAEVESGGLVRIDMSDPYPDFYSPNFYFKLWVCESSDGNDVIPFTIDSVAYECLSVLFKPIQMQDSIYVIDDITLKV